MDKKEKAVQLHKEGYNCAQCVVCQFAEELDFSVDDVFRISEAFGGGMGHLGTCGAVSGMAMVLGMKNSGGVNSPVITKGETRKLIRKGTDKFLEKNKALTCRELKGIDSGIVLRPCDDCIKDAIEITEEILKEL